MAEFFFLRLQSNLQRTSDAPFQLIRRTIKILTFVKITKAGSRQGDRFGRILAFWAIVFLWAVLLKSSGRQYFMAILSADKVMCINFDKNGLRSI
jgi:hypothetical protein